jgi:hypothetical protein
MANAFLRKTSRAIGTTPVTVGGYTVAAATQVTVIGLSVSNITASPLTVTVNHSDGTNLTSLVKTAPIPVGSSLVVIGGDQKLVLQSGDSVQVTASVASGVDVVMSVLEIT